MTEKTKKWFITFNNFSYFIAIVLNISQLSLVLNWKSYRVINILFHWVICFKQIKQLWSLYDYYGRWEVYAVITNKIIYPLFMLHR